MTVTEGGQLDKAGSRLWTHQQGGRAGTRQDQGTDQRWPAQAEQEPARGAAGPSKEPGDPPGPPAALNCPVASGRPGPGAHWAARVLTWAPVRMTVFCRFSSMKESTEAAKAMVSVPWMTTKPWYCP